LNLIHIYIYNIQINFIINYLQFLLKILNFKLELNILKTDQLKFFAQNKCLQTKLFATFFIEVYTFNITNQNF